MWATKSSHEPYPLRRALRALSRRDGAEEGAEDVDGLQVVGDGAPRRQLHGPGAQLLQGVGDGAVAGAQAEQRPGWPTAAKTTSRAPASSRSREWTRGALPGPEWTATARPKLSHPAIPPPWIHPDAGPTSKEPACPESASSSAS
jgi:hypothetical protein